MGKRKETTDATVAYVNSQEAAQLLGYTLQHTRLLVRIGQLKAIKFGRDWMIERKSIADFNTQKKQKQ